MTTAAKTATPPTIGTTGTTGATGATETTATTETTGLTATTATTATTETTTDDAEGLAYRDMVRNRAGLSRYHRVAPRRLGWTVHVLPTVLAERPSS